MPTSAVWIIETSLAPSPMARVMTFKFSFTERTTDAFWRGVALQHRTELQYWDNSKNGSITSCLKTNVSVFPSITIPLLLRTEVSISSEFQLNLAPIRKIDNKNVNHLGGGGLGNTLFSPFAWSWFRYLLRTGNASSYWGTDISLSLKIW